MNSTRRRSVDTDTASARLGVRFARLLTTQSEQLPNDLSERLRVARGQAVARARSVRQAAPAHTTGGFVVNGGSGAAALGGFGGLRGFAPWAQRLASVLPVAMLVLGLMLIDHYALREQVMAAAEIDTQLLSDDLPPAAYSDPGFAEYLRTEPAP